MVPFLPLACIIDRGRAGHCTDTLGRPADVLRNEPREEITGAASISFYGDRWPFEY